jgi:hypothetical protein
MLTILILNALSSLIAGLGVAAWRHRTARPRGDVQPVYVTDRR